MEIDRGSKGNPLFCSALRHFMISIPSLPRYIARGQQSAFGWKEDKAKKTIGFPFPFSNIAEPMLLHRFLQAYIFLQSF